MDVAVYPTQLYEAAFLILLSVILLLLAYKKDFKYNICIYLSSYGIFRFFLEFLRGDDRGFTLLSLSPSQLISILALIASIITYLKLKNDN